MRSTQQGRLAAEVRAGAGRVGGGVPGAGAVPELGRDGTWRHRRPDAGRGGGLGGLARRASRGDGASSGELSPAPEAGRTRSHCGQDRPHPPDAGLRLGIRGEPGRPFPGGGRHRDIDGGQNGSRPDRPVVTIRFCRVGDSPMSRPEVPVPAARRLLNTLRSGRPLHYAAIGLVHSRFAEYVHLNPERLAKAEGWFKRYGVLAIIFGRHIPGFRVPITVASGIFNVPYRVFAPSVAVSTAIWAGVMLTLGMLLGPRLAVLLNAHGWVYFIWGAIVVALIGGMYLRQRRASAGAAERRRPDRPVESPSS